ncbi:AraC family transcriptional regulator [Marinobacter confluentis]|uniref:AraC family transcriptional regulator n=1 Tax=Marinobacter confluentis TaxID=1697557 RepID=A0A4Z1C3Q1_9GAMM|nr:AraC family transcriptional regulator [Marinobacter confluentis]TGN41858.1 AraC family transcriptional regulator [Marinobacter confluentis]
MKPKKETLKLTTKTIIQCFHTAHQSLSDSWHYYEEYELRYCPDFKGEVHIGDYCGPVPSSSIFLIAPNLARSWVRTTENPPGVKSHHDGLSCAAFFPGSAISNAQRLFPELNNLTSMMDDARFGLRFDLGPETTEIGTAISQLKEENGCKRLCSFLTILDRLRHVSYQTLSSTTDTGESQSQRCEALDRALDYINRNFDQAIDLETVAGVACMSPSHFCRLFKATFNTGLIDYVNSLRTQRMCVLLARTNRSVSAIAMETGFTNLSNCNRAFKARMKMSPSKYRDKCWAKQDDQIPDLRDALGMARVQPV